MIERKFVSQKIREKQVQGFVASQLTSTTQDKIEIKRTPLGEKVIVYTSRPGLLVGRKGENIRSLTVMLKDKFKMENPQIEVGEIGNPNLSASSVADKIAYTLERFGPKRFKFIGYNTLQTIMNAGAMGAEIVIGGRGVPGKRAKSWRFSAGHLKKSGDVSDTKVLKAGTVANLKSGTIGIKVRIMPPNITLPDSIKVREIKASPVESPPEIKEEKKEKKPRKRVKKVEEDGNDKKE